MCVSVQALLLDLFIKVGVKGGHYRSEGFVCLSVIRRACADNLVDVVDRLLIVFLELVSEIVMCKFGQLKSKSE